ncbi:MAG: Rid family hydrolase [Pseudomonadota bacterium]
MQKRQKISSNSPLEDSFGYSRAVKTGDWVFVSGSTAIQPDGSVIGEGDAYAQAKAALQTIGKALTEAGATFRGCRTHPGLFHGYGR